MAHRRTQSQRYPTMNSPLALESPPLTPTLAVFGSLTTRNPKSYWYRTTFLALFALVVLSVYVLLVAQPSLSSIPMFDPDGARHPPSRISSEAYRLAALRHKHAAGVASVGSAGSAERPQIELDSAQELAAVSSFIASLPQNVIPSFVDPSRPIDPQLVLDFDTRSVQAVEEVQTVVNEVWARNPVMLYSKFYSPVSREIKQMLSEMYLSPSPTIIEVDQRTDESVLAPLLFRLTSKAELPILLIGGRPVQGSLEELRYLKKKGELQRMISAAGAEIYGAKKKQRKF